MNARSYFLKLSTIIVVLNILSGISALFLIERLIPSIGHILKDNGTSISTSLAMLEHLFLTDVTDLEASRKHELAFWVDFEQAKKNATLPEEPPIIAEIQSKATLFWGGEIHQRPSLSLQIQELAQFNMRVMQDRAKKTQFLGLTGAWGVGVLLLITIGLQLFLRRRMMKTLIHPLDEIAQALHEHQTGNPQRRFTLMPNDNETVKDIKDLINQILDASKQKEG